MTRWGTADRLMCGLIASGVLLLSACGFTPLKADRKTDRMQITWSHDVARCPPNTEACATYNTKHCLIRSPEVQGQDDYRGIELLGHEALHCFRGRWH